MAYNQQVSLDLRISELVRNLTAEQLHEFILHEVGNSEVNYSRHLEQRKEFLTFYSTYIQLAREGSQEKKIQLELDAVTGQIMEHFDSSQKFLLTRWGDGEGMILPYIEHLNGRYPMKNLYLEKGSPKYMNPLVESAEWAWWRLWFGRKIIDESNLKLRMLAQDIELAITKSHLIGYWSPEPSELLARGWSTFRRSFGILALNPVISSLSVKGAGCSASIQVRLFKSGILEELIKRSSRVMLVTGRHKVKDLLSENFGDKFDLISIPTTNPKGLLALTDQNESARNFLEEFETISSSINNYMTPDLVLVGGGFIGKALAYRISTIHPTVILDIGAVFDEWAGIKTRQWMK